jgi:hypothetical protein
MVSAVEKAIPKTSANRVALDAMSSSWCEIDIVLRVRDSRRGDRLRSVSPVTLAEIEARKQISVSIRNNSALP